MRVISVINQKGGCGKTTISINLSSILSSQGSKVLLIDLDAQGHATLGLSVSPDGWEYTAYHLFSETDRERVWISAAAQGIRENLDLVAGSSLCYGLDAELAGVVGKDQLLQAKILACGSAYDFVIIDCPPYLGVLSINALVASGEAIVPLDPSLFSLHGLGRLFEVVEMIRIRYDKNIRMKALLNMTNRRTRFAAEFAAEVRRFFPEATFAGTIRHTVKLKEAAGHGRPIDLYCPGCPVCEDFEAVADELVSDRPCEHYSEEQLRMLPHRENGAVAFQLEAPQASDVRLAGDFNQWNPASCFMYRDEADGRWKARLPMEPGFYQYRYVVDGRWIPDPLNPLKIDDTMGGLNSFIGVS